MSSTRVRYEKTPRRVWIFPPKLFLASPTCTIYKAAGAQYDFEDTSIYNSFLNSQA